MQIASRLKVQKAVMREQRDAEEELAVMMNRRLVKEVIGLFKRRIQKISNKHSTPTRQGVAAVRVCTAQ